MRMFKKRDKPLSVSQQQAAGKIANGILSRQRKAADYLNGKTARISGKGWLILLIVFCALFGSYCLYLLIRAFY